MLRWTCRTFGVLFIMDPRAPRRFLDTRDKLRRPDFAGDIDPGPELPFREPGDMMNAPDLWSFVETYWTPGASAGVWRRIGPACPRSCG